MKKTIVKAVVVCTLALALLTRFTSVPTLNVINTGASVYHDGPINGTVVQ